MTRDSQRSKVYSAEFQLFTDAYMATQTPDSAAKLIRRTSRKFYTSAPEILWVHRNSIYGVTGRYVGQLNVIKLYYNGKQLKNAGTVLHEYAHHLCAKTYGRYGIAPHGPEYIRCLVEVMKWAGYFKGKFSMGKAKIRIAPADLFWEACHARRDRKRGS